MNDNTSWTPSAADNLLGIIDKDVINEYEAKGLAKAEIFIFNLDENTDSCKFIKLLLRNSTIGQGNIVLLKL